MDNAYRAYEAVREALAAGTAPGSIAGLERFLPDPGDADNAALMERLLGTVFDADVLYDFLAEKFRDILAEAEEQGRARGGQLSWNAGFHGRAALVAHERTGEDRFLDLYADLYQRALPLRDDALGAHDDYHGKVMTSWGVAGETAATNAGFGIWVSHVTHYGVMMQPATELARRVLADPGLGRHKALADRIVADFDTGYREFDYDLRHLPGTDEIWYWRPVKFLYEPTNHVHLIGEAMLNHHAVTGDALYAERIRSFIRTFEKSATVNKKGVVGWNYHPYFAQSGSRNNRRQKSELTWKASHTIQFVYAADRMGFAVDPDLLAAMTRTIRDHVLAGNDFAGNIHPRGSKPYLERFHKEGVTDHPKALTITGYLAAAEADPTIRERVRRIVATRRDMFPHGWLKPAERKAYSKGPLGYAHMLGRA